MDIPKWVPDTEATYTFTVARTTGAFHVAFLYSRRFNQRGIHLVCVEIQPIVE